MFFQEKDKLTLVAPPDTVEFDPTSNALAVGCYNYNAETKERTGSLSVYDTTNLKLELLATIETNAILDIKWKNNLVYCATSNNSILCVDWQTSSNSLLPVQELQKEEKSLCLALDISPFNNTLISAHSDGTVKLWVNGNCHCFQENSLDIWSVSFDTNCPFTFYSGSDDSTFKIWDSRQQSSVHTNKSHDAGVTSFSNDPSDANILLSGSYDDRMLFWDKRNFGKPFHQFKSAGGVWRIRFSPSNPQIIAIAAMYGGFQVYNRYNLEEISIPTQSIAYGISWNSQKKNFLAASSFYDSLLGFWEIKFDL